MNRTLPISLKVNPNEINISPVQNINKTIEPELSVLKNNKFFNKFITSIHKNNSLVLKPIISGSFSPNGELTNIKITVNPNIKKMKFQKSPIMITTAIQNLRSHLTPLIRINPGTFTIMIGVESNDFSISKKIKFNVY